MMHTAVPWMVFVFYSKYYKVFVSRQSITPIWNYCRAKFYISNLYMHQDPKNTEEYI